jgi:hypothetical protein
MSIESHACDENLCIGDKVFRGSLYKDGGIVMFLDDEKLLAYLRVKSPIHDQEIIVAEKYENLDITKGCIQNFCVGNEVYLNSKPNEEMQIVGVNPYSGYILISGPNYLFEHALSELVKI